MIRYYGIYVRHRKIDKNPMDLLDMDMIDDLRSLRFISKNENVIFLGTPNVGKTHLTIALRISVIENKYSAYFISCFWRLYYFSFDSKTTVSTVV